MRYGTWRVAVLLSIVCLWSDRLLAAEGVRVSALQKDSKATTQVRESSPTKLTKQTARTRKNTDAASSVAATAVSVGQSVEEVSDVPKMQDETVPLENAPQFEMKGVRG